jgi:hypothetical protein
MCHLEISTTQDFGSYIIPVQRTDPGQAVSPYRVEVLKGIEVAKKMANLQYVFAVFVHNM